MPNNGDSVSIDRVELEALRKGSRMFDDAIGFLALQHGCPLTVTKEAPREECYDCTEESDSIHEDCWRAFFERREAETREMEPKEWCKQHVNDLQLTHAQVMGFQATVGAAAMENLDRAVKAEAACIAKDIAIRQALTWDTPRSEMRAYLEPALTPDIGDEFRKRYDEAVAAAAGKDETLEAIVNRLCVNLHHCTPYDSQMFNYCEGCEVADVRRMVNAALAPTLGASILQRQKEQDAALAQMRGALRNSLVYIQEYRDVCGDSLEADKVNELNEVLNKGNAALSSSPSASTLEYIRGLEGDNKAMRGLLRRSREIDCLPKCDDLNINTQMCDMRGGQCQWCALNAAIDSYLKGGVASE